MPKLSVIRDPRQLAAAGLSGEPVAVRCDFDSGEISAWISGDWTGYTVTIIGLDERSASIGGPRRREELLDGLPNEVGESVVTEPAFVEVRLEGTSASIVRHLYGDFGERLDARHIEGLDKRQLARLMRGRHLAMLDWRYTPRPGRPIDSRKIPPEKFERKVRAYLADRRSQRSHPTVPEDIGVICDSIGLSKATFKKYLRDAGTSWEGLKGGEWPV